MKKSIVIALIIMLPLLYASYWLGRAQSTISNSPAPSTVTEPSVSNSEVIIPQNQPRRTNSWFTSAYAFPSEVIFALPGSYKITTNGIEIGAPQPYAGEKGVFAPHIPWCTITTKDKILTGSNINYYGEWDVNISVSSPTQTITTHLAQGMPVATYQSELPLQISCSKPVTIENGALVITEAGARIVVQSENGTCTESQPNTYSCNSSTGSYRSIVLPVDATIDISTLPWNRLRLTQSSFTTTDSKIKTTLSFNREQDTPILTTLWPHQQKIIQNNSEILGTYQTSRGPMQLIRTNELIFEQSSINLPNTFTAITDPAGKRQLIQKMNEDIAQYLNESSPGGVYFKGTWLGALTSLIQLNQIYGTPQDTVKLLDKLKTELDAGLATLYYDEKDTMVKARNDEFGNSEGNDHHFHYSYYIRGAAVLIEARPELAPIYKEKINELIADIASTKTTEKFPHYRSFNIYEGHSYADGDAKFADGNNQESTSESLNAWYSLHVWGKVTDDLQTQQLGQWLFTQELNAVSHYWFFPPELKPAGFGHEMFSIVWLGKRDYATWFSGHPLHIYGIQWLPITPASHYLKTFPNREAHLKDLEQQLGAEIYNHEWSDLYVSYVSTVNPELAKQKLPQLQTSAGAKLRSLPWQYVYSME